MLNWLIKNTLCRWKGHRRGKRIATVNGLVQYECPRCETQWHRKERKPAKLKAVA